MLILFCSKIKGIYSENRPPQTGLWSWMFSLAATNEWSSDPSNVLCKGQSSSVTWLSLRMLQNSTWLGSSPLPAVWKLWPTTASDGSPTQQGHELLYLSSAVQHTSFLTILLFLTKWCASHMCRQMYTFICDFGFTSLKRGDYITNRSESVCGLKKVMSVEIPNSQSLCLKTAKEF